MKETEIGVIKLGRLPASKMRLSDLFITISRALDMGSYEILAHSSRVAYIVLEIAEMLDLNEKEKNKLILAALIHDIGIIDHNDKVKAKKFFEIEEDIAESHCKVGAKLTANFNFLPGLSNIIYYHHHNWDGNNFDRLKRKEIPFLSRIIRLADRIEARINSDYFILNQIEVIIKDIKSKSGIWFDPYLVKLFLDLSQKEAFWLNLKSEEHMRILEKWGETTQTNIKLSDLESLASTVAHLIDSISPFTSRHSSGVATIAAMITSDLGFDSQQQRAIRIAGLFHDLGKLIIPNKILEKKDNLTAAEYNIIKQHTFYTYKLLNRVQGLGSIPEWAAFHHERLDGTGYPFRVKAENINLGSRIMALSDVFQALTEDRPYRSSFSITKALKIIDQMQENLKLDGYLVSILKNAI